MTENGNDNQRRILSCCAGDSFEERWIPVVANVGNSLFPLPPLREVPFIDEQETTSDPYIEDPTCCGRLFEQDAICALYRFITTVHQVPGASHSDGFFMIKRRILKAGSSEWTCDVTLPLGLLKGSISGPPCSTLTHARRAAAFRACLELYEYGLFDHRLFPLPPPSRSLMNMNVRQVPSTENVSNKRCYPRKETQFWSNSMRLFSHRWYPVVIRVQSRANYAPVLLLTRQPLPHLAQFHLFIDGISSVVQNDRGAPVEINTDRSHALHLYTLRICRSILNKPFACSANDMAYMFAPLSLSTTDRLIDLTRVLDFVPWNMVSLAASQWAVKFSPERLRSSQDVEDVVVQDRMVEFTRRYYALCLRCDLTPLSKPEDSPVRKKIT